MNFLYLLLIETITPIINSPEFTTFIHALFPFWGKWNLALCKEHAIFREKIKWGHVLRVKNHAPAKWHSKSTTGKRIHSKWNTKMLQYPKVSISGVNNPPLWLQALERKRWHWINPEKENQSAPQTVQTALLCEWTAFLGLLAGKLYQSLWGFVLCFIFLLERKLA